MYEVASKIVWALADPANLLLICLAFGFAAGWARRTWLRRLGRTVAGLALLLGGALAVLPLGDWILRPLESRFPVPEEPAEVDGIVVLGGAVELEVSIAAGHPQLGPAAERLTAFVALARRHPEAALLFTGGYGTLRASRGREADVAAAFLAGLGLDPARVRFDRAARNTRENALQARALAKPASGDTWLPVTSAAHMPRAIGTFRRIGWAPLAYPVDFNALPAVPGEGLRLDFDLGRGLFLARLALHEWLGLIAYRLLGWTETLFPAP
ncbi:MAG TPA: YdcF family protein [Kiloniellales bacterium]|nr:YdcF family protein [Kiloniellales bacterium]